MRRREFITLLGSVASIWPFVARAQQSALPIVGFLNSDSPDGHGASASAFVQAMRDAGYADGQSMTIEYHWAENHNDRLPVMAADLVRRQVALIIANTPAALAAKSITTTIPIIFTTAGDPIHLGLVSSLNRPGGNVTGVTELAAETTPKGLQLMHELVPEARVMALLVNPANPGLANVETASVLSAAHDLGLQLQILKASTAADFEPVFADLTELRAGGLVIAADPVFTGQSAQLGALSLHHAKPAVYHGREFTAAGGLISYGSSTPDAYRLAGIYAARILKGEKPADLPVQQATKVELYINLKTAKALGITIPLPLLGRADEVIE